MLGSNRAMTVGAADFSVHRVGQRLISVALDTVEFLGCSCAHARQERKKQQVGAGADSQASDCDHYGALFFADTEFKYDLQVRNTIRDFRDTPWHSIGLSSNKGQVETCQPCLAGSGTMLIRQFMRISGRSR
jgi:hypothetical protein